MDHTNIFVGSFLATPLPVNISGGGGGGNGDVGLWLV